MAPENSNRLSLNAVAPNPSPSESPLRRFWGILNLDQAVLRAAAIFQVLQALTYLPFFAGVGILVDKVLQNPALTNHQRYLYILYYALANLALWPLHAWCTVNAFAKTQTLVREAVAQMRRLLVDKLQLMSLSFFTRRGSGALANQVTVDLGRVETFLSNVVGTFLIQMSLCFGALVYLLWLSPLLTLVTLLAIPLQYVVVRRMRRQLERLNQHVQESSENFSARVVEFIGGMRVTKSLGNEERVANELSEVIERVRGAGIEASIKMRWVSMGIQIIMEYTGVIVWCLGGVLYLRGTLPLGSLVVFTSTFGFLRDVEHLWKAGFALGSSLDNTVALDDERVLNPEGLRFADEFVRHKTLDAIGDLSLAGAPILGAYRSYCGGHKMNSAVLDALFADPSAYEFVEAPRQTVGGGRTDIRVAASPAFAADRS